MIKSVSHVVVYVLDQERAVRFYTNALSFSIRTDTTLDGFRWVSVGPDRQPDVAFLLAEPVPPMFSPEDGAAVKALVVKGAFCGGVLETDDCRATYEDLRPRGVTFLEKPTARPHGIEAVFRDDSGNWFSLTERHQPE